MASPEAQFPVGFRFRPTEEELVDYYLKRKLDCDESVNDTIAEVDVCKVEPWDLPDFSKVKSDDSEWFFFSPRALKYTNSNRSNRATVGGYWKATGKERNIKTRGTNKVIGIKKTLVFYKEKTKRKVEGKDAFINDQEEPSHHMASDYENQALSDGVPNVYSLPEVDMDSILLKVEHDSTTIQQEPSFQQASIPNAFYGNKTSSNKFLFETIEEEYNFEAFLKSFFINEDPSLSEERRHACASDFVPSESTRKTDAELIST